MIKTSAAYECTMSMGRNNITRCKAAGGQRYTWRSQSC